MQETYLANSHRLNCCICDHKNQHFISSFQADHRALGVEEMDPNDSMWNFCDWKQQCKIGTISNNLTTQEHVIRSFFFFQVTSHT